MNRRLRWRASYGWRRDGEPDGQPLPPVPEPPDARFRSPTDKERREAALAACWEQFNRNTSAGPIMAAYEHPERRAAIEADIAAWVALKGMAR